MRLSLDIETYSDVDLAGSGVYRYAESPEFALLLLGYSVDGGPVEVIDVQAGHPLPAWLVKALSDPSVEKWAYNATFERICLSRYLNRRYLDPEGWRCSMVWASALGLPGSLARVGDALNLEKQKLSIGTRLIKRYCKPNSLGRRNLPGSFDLDWQDFIEYNRRDVETEMLIQRHLRNFPLPDTVWAEYELDQRINDRGVLVDTDLVESAIELDETLSRDLIRRMQRITGLFNPRSVTQLGGWLREHGVSLDTLGKQDVAAQLKQVTDFEAREVLMLRQQTAKSSVAKYRAIRRAVCSDGRIHGMFQFWGAARTGRWAGRLVQPQNLPQNHIEPLDCLRRLVKTRDAASLEMLYDAPLDVLSQLLRTTLVAPPGMRFIVADFSAIEARVLAWLAGEQWVLDTFVEGGDIYCATASQMFSVPVVKHGENGHLRAKGKVAVLACGYGGSVGALEAMGAGAMGLSREEMQDTVDKWREANPRIVSFWWETDRAVSKAVSEHTETVARGIRFTGTRTLLRITLPSGRTLSYVHPRVEERGVSFMGTSTGGAWCRLKSYGPKFVENITQATARDLLSAALMRLGDLRIVMHIHDELVIEAPAALSLDYVCKRMAEAPDWARGLPLRADGYVTEFYKKD